MGTKGKGSERGMSSTGNKVTEGRGGRKKRGEEKKGRRKRVSSWLLGDGHRQLSISIPKICFGCQTCVSEFFVRDLGQTTDILSTGHRWKSVANGAQAKQNGLHGYACTAITRRLRDAQNNQLK